MEIDRFWIDAFSSYGKTYSSPQILSLENPIETGCGPASSADGAFYCPLDYSIYLSPYFLADLDSEFGDYAPMTVLAHEWGHHVQNLLGLQKRQPAEFELQADCLTGVFTKHARDSKLLDVGDVIEAMNTSESHGDPVFMHEDDPRAHGNSEERVLALTEGYWLGPVQGCGVPLSSPRSSDTVSTGQGDESSSGVGSTGDQGSTQSLGAPLLPSMLPLAHSRCFDIVDGGPLTFSQLLDRFAGFPDANARLQGWGWRASAYRQFGCDGPPDGDAGWIDISVHGFSSATSAQEAVDYFAATRMDGTSLRSADGPGVGDFSVALVGPASNGTEFTIYATRGPWLVRVTGVSPSGIPFMNVRTVAADVLSAQDVGGNASGPSGSNPQDSTPTWSSSAYLPTTLNINYAECFRAYTSGTYDRSDVVAAFARTNAGEIAVDTYGWKDGAYVVFRCDNPPYGRAGQIEVLIHQFRDAQVAQQVEGAVRNFHIPGDHESRACETAGAFVICVSGYSETGSPLSDVHFVLNQVVASAR